MTEDASLLDFDGERSGDADGDGGDDGDPTTESDADPAAADGGATDTDPSPATPTYRWSPDGTPCPDCGTATRRRWHDGDEFVCADCKDW